jgi:hypothetical protein
VTILIGGIQQILCCAGDFGFIHLVGTMAAVHVLRCLGHHFRARKQFARRFVVAVAFLRRLRGLVIGEFTGGC